MSLSSGPENLGAAIAWKASLQQVSVGVSCPACRPYSSEPCSLYLCRNPGDLLRVALIRGVGRAETVSGATHTTRLGPHLEQSRYRR